MERKEIDCTHFSGLPVANLKTEMKTRSTRLPPFEQGPRAEKGLFLPCMKSGVTEDLSGGILLTGEASQSDFLVILLANQ
jgi:hypothetical protein